MLLLTLAVYAGTLGYPFVWDDETLIVNNPNIRALGNLPSLFAQDLFWNEGANSIYRPLQSVSNALNYALGGTNPAGYHLANICLHGAVALLLWRFFALLTGRARAAWVAALLWAAHPLHAETVTYVAARAHLMTALFVLASMQLVLRGRRLPAVPLYLAALYSSEMGLLFAPLLLLTLKWSEPGVSPVALARRFLPFLGASGIYLLSRWLALGQMAEAAWNPHPLKLLSFPPAVLYSARLTFYPHPLFMDRPAPALGPHGLPVGLLSLLLLAGAGFLLWRKRRAAPALYAGALWTLAAFFPLTVILSRDTFLFDHDLYLPSFGVLFLSVAAVSGLARKYAAAARAATLLATCLLAALTVRQNRVWESDLSLFEHVTWHAPQSWRAWTRLGEALERRQRLAEAAGAYAQAHGLAGHSLLKAREILARARSMPPDEGIALLGAALGRLPDDFLLLHLRAGLYARTGRFDEAEADLRRVLAKRPDYREAWINLGLLQLGRGKREEARASYEKAAELRLDADLALRLAELYRDERPRKAIEILERALAAEQDIELARALARLKEQFRLPSGER